MKHNIFIFENANKTAQAVADLICKKALEHKKHGKYLNIAVSGGNTPRELFAIMGQEFKSSIPWEILRIFWVDERCVDPTDSESNYRMTEDALLYQGFIPSENIFRMKGEDSPALEAKRYQEVLIAELPVSNGFPVFDLILLGIGNDGHTASIFPDNLALFESDLSVAVAIHPESKQKRISLTGKLINNAEQLVFMVAGERKSRIVSNIIGKTAQAKLYPASYIQNSKGSVDFYLDESAASEL
jgi:6-phosphogluconolactonase